jgi:hypothetical protein
LGDSDRELAIDAVVGCVFQIEPARTEEKAHQAVVFRWLKHSFQIEAVFPVFLSLSEDGGIKSILLLDGGIL